MNKDIILTYYNKSLTDENEYTVNCLTAHHTEITIKPVNLFLKEYTELGLDRVYKLLDDQNGVTLNLDKRKIKLDYSELEYILLLSKLRTKHCETYESTYKVYSIKEEGDL